MAINEGFEDGLDRAEELQLLVDKQNELLFDPKILKRWSESGRIEETGTPGLWLYKF